MVSKQENGRRAGGKITNFSLCCLCRCEAKINDLLIESNAIQHQTNLHIIPRTLTDIRTKSFNKNQSERADKLNKSLSDHREMLSK